MSRAEQKAHEIFSSMQLATMDDEVRRHLMILLLTVPQQKKNNDSRFPSTYEEAMLMGARDIECVREDLHAYVDQLSEEYDIR